MILYLDASTLVKRYIAEKSPELVNGWTETDEMAVTRDRKRQVYRS